MDQDTSAGLTCWEVDKSDYYVQRCESRNRSEALLSDQMCVSGDAE